MINNKSGKKLAGSSRIKKALLLLVANNYDYDKTCERLDIHRTTLQRWHLKHASLVFKEVSEAEVLEEEVGVAVIDILNTDAQSEEKFILLVKELRHKTVTKLITAVNQTDDVKKLGSLLGTIHKITSGELPVTPGGVVNYFTMIQNKYHLNNGTQENIDPDKGNK